jgi:hypothetical protein
MDQPPARVVDGVHAADEYWGAVEIPYAQLNRQASGGRLLVTVDDPDVGARTLHIFLDDIPVDVNARELSVFTDLNRFVTGPSGLDPFSDRAFVFDLVTSGFEVRRPPFVPTAPRTWLPAGPVAGADGVLGGCFDDMGQTGAIRRCDAELEIGIPPNLSEAPAVGELPGIGIAVAEDGFGGAMPEELAQGLPAGDELSFTRTNYVTLLFARPPSIPLRFATWNTRRFTAIEGCFQGGDDFRDVDLADQAAFVADNDVIALQEVWSEEEARQLQSAVNALRPPDSPMTLVGPVDRSAEFGNLCSEYLETLASTIGLICTGGVGPFRPDSHGGLWILSRYPIIAQDYVPFDDCRGEDCFKAKGVQWARLWLRPPTVDNTMPNCLVPGVGAGCPPGPTSELYVDVFNVHLQAGDPALCDSTLADALRPIVEANFCTPLGPIMNSDFNCFGPGDGTVRVRQLERLAAFIADVTGDSPGQMAIVAGDFNIDGRRIGAGRRYTGFGYARTSASSALAPRVRPTLSPCPMTSYRRFPMPSSGTSTTVTSRARRRGTG